MTDVVEQLREDLDKVLSFPEDQPIEDIVIWNDRLRYIQDKYQRIRNTTFEDDDFLDFLEDVSVDLYNFPDQIALATALELAPILTEALEKFS